MLLIYGFRPFDGLPRNVTQEIVSQLPAHRSYRTKVFAVEFDRTMFEREFEKVRPSKILGLGQTAHGERLQVERCARNVMAARGGEPLPIESSCEDQLRILQWQLPEHDLCEMSEDAGSYVCNYSMWVAHEWARQNSAVSAFIHVPATYDVGRAVRFLTSLYE